MFSVGLSSYIDVERSHDVNASRQAVWEWMLDPNLQLFKVNAFHKSACLQDERLQTGSRVLIHHNFLRVYRQRRVARINTLREFEIGWGELAQYGTDYFPHSQRFRIEATSNRSCRLSNRLRGRVNVPAAPLWWMPWFRIFAPRGLDDELRQIARGVDVGLGASRPCSQRRQDL